MTSQAIPALDPQLGVWLHIQKSGYPGMYHIERRHSISGPLDPQRLESALRQLVARHDALRLRFRQADDVLLLEPREHLPWNLQHRTLPHPSAQEIQSILTEFEQRPFDLEQDPMLRALLLCIGQDHHILCIVMHHIAVDGVSLATISQELAALYAGEPLAPAPSFVALAQQRHDWTTSQQHQDHASFWRETLKNAPQNSGLPSFSTSTPSTTTQPVAGVIERHIPLQQTRAFNKFAGGLRSTPNIAMLAVLAACLRRHGAPEDIIIGSPFSGRLQEGLDAIVGMTVETLPLRLQCSLKTTFRDHLKTITGKLLEAYCHLPVSLTNALNNQKRPDIQILFGYQALGDLSFQLPGTETTSHSGSPMPAPFPIAIFAYPGPDGVRIDARYNQSLYAADEVTSLIDNWLFMLEQVPAYPDCPLSDLPCVPPDHAHNLTISWARKTCPYPHHQTIPALFTEQARSHPDKLAICGSDTTLTYQALHQRAASLAAALLAQDIGPGHRVGVCLERSADSIVALIGVLLSGAAYVPLDPEYPPARIAFMVDDAQVSRVLTHQPCFSRLTNGGIPCQRIEELTARAPFTAPSIDPLSPAYLMYTSGTTGQPKGSLIPHRGIVRLVKNTNYTELNHESVLLQLASPSFDAATYEIFGALLNGGTLALLPPGTPSIRDIRHAIQEYGVTHTFLTAGLFNTIVDTDIQILAPLQQVITGGEAGSATHLVRFLEALPSVQLTNGYGPTENTTFSICHHFQLPLPTDRPVPIGQPVSNSEAYVLDEHMHPLPIAVEGDLYLGGDGLSLGYWQRDALNAQAFLPHPFRPGERLYRTGDRASIQADGTFLFLGRQDTQVKVRGYRIELDGVEQALLQHPAVSQCCAVPVGHTSASRSIAAAIVATTPAPPEQLIAAAAKHAQKLLPPYMRPSQWVVIDTLPLTHNRKVDRAQIAAQFASKRPAHAKIIPPASPTETLLLEIWKRVLSLDKISCDHNFFELGGNSLAAMRMVADLERRSDLRLPLNQLFQHPTIQRLAATLADNSGPISTLVPLRPGDDTAPLFLIHGWGGDVFCYIDFANNLTPTLSVYGVQGLEHTGATEANSFEEMARRYANDICHFYPNGPLLLGGFSVGGMIAYAVACELRNRGRHIAHLLVMDSTPPNLPADVYYAAKADYLIPRLKHHLQALLRQSPKDSVRYIRGRVKALQYHIRPGYAANNTKAAPSEQAPPSHFGEHYADLSQLYVPNPSDFPVTVVLATGQRPFNLTAMWQHLVPEHLQIVQAERPHLDLLEDESLASLVSRIGLRVFSQ